MNLLDENIIESQRLRLRQRRVAIRQVGVDCGHKRMTDGEIIALLHQLNRTTFFTRDNDFYRPGLCHRRYCLVVLDVNDDDVADYVVRVLRHPQLSSWSKRVGAVIRVSSNALRLWRLDEQKELELPW